MGKNESGPLPQSIYRKELKIDQRPKKKKKPIKLLEESIKENLHANGFGNGFLDIK